MLNKLISLNEAVSLLITNKLSMLILSRLPYEVIPTYLKMFSDCTNLSKLPELLQACFLRNSKDYDYYMSNKVLASTAKKLYSNSDFLGFTAYDEQLMSIALSKAFSDTDVVVSLLNRKDITCDTFTSAYHNAVSHCADIMSGLLPYSIWKSISWETEYLKLVTKSTSHLALSQFLSTHLLNGIVIPSAAIYYVVDAPRCLHNLIRLWFNTKDNPETFSMSVLEYANNIMLDVLPVTPDVSSTAVINSLFPNYAGVINSIDYEMLPYCTKSLVLHNMLQHRDGFFSFIEKNNISLNGVDSSIMGARWFHQYVNCNDISKSMYDMLLEIPITEPYKLYKVTRVETLLNKLTQ